MYGIYLIFLSTFLQINNSRIIKVPYCVYGHKINAVKQVLNIYLQSLFIL
jgi:hypothetical protein